MKKTLYLIAGEASGDTHAAELMKMLRSLDPSMVFHGAGGPRMAEWAAPPFDDWSEEANVLGLWDVLRKYGYFRTKFRAMAAEIIDKKPDAVIFVDYPGFNLRMAQAIRPHLPQTRLIYYISPQVWAWKRGRIPKMARLLDRMLCIFPFEKPLYEKSGLPTDFVGHPMIERLQKEKGTFDRNLNLVGLFPGSREREVRHIFPSMLEAAKMIRHSRPLTQFEASAASPRLADLMQTMISASGLPCSLRTGKSHRLMQTACAALVCSGTATLEAAYFGLPYALVYKVAWLTYAVGRIVVTIPYLGMVNILADHPVIREFIQQEAQPKAMAEEMIRLLDHPQEREALQKKLEGVINSLHGKHASRQAAEAILKELDFPSQS